jgi:hypothetical protein
MSIEASPSIAGSPLCILDGAGIFQAVSSLVAEWSIVMGLGSVKVF